MEPVDGSGKPGTESHQALGAINILLRSIWINRDVQYLILNRILAESVIGGVVDPSEGNAGSVFSRTKR